MSAEAQLTRPRRLRTWFETKANAVWIIELPFRAPYEQALLDESSGRKRHATRGLGDAAFGWLMPNLETVTPAGTVPLVLTEDRNLSLTLAHHRVAHILSTRAWLLGLENAHVIESAAEVIEQISRHGRTVSTLQTDFPVSLGDVQTDWIGESRGSGPVDDLPS